MNAPTRSLRSDRAPARPAPRGLALHALCLALLAPALASTGCGALLLVGGAGTSAIAFATGELRVTEEVSLSALHEATRSLIARGPERTDLRIRVGVFGSEARSRLVLEQIRQAM